jgi:hypothetical protein
MAMRELAGEHPAKAPPDQEHGPAVIDFVEPPPELLERIGPGAAIHAEVPRMDAPPGTREGTADVHRRTIAG